MHLPVLISKSNHHQPQIALKTRPKRPRSPPQGYGVYRFANKYGANVDGYSPIYTPDTWSESGETRFIHLHANSRLRADASAASPTLAMAVASSSWHSCSARAGTHLLLPLLACRRLLQAGHQGPDRLGRPGEYSVCRSRAADWLSQPRRAPTCVCTSPRPLSTPRCVHVGAAPLPLLTMCSHCCVLQIVVLLGVGINLVISTSALGEHWLS